MWQIGTFFQNDINERKKVWVSVQIYNKTLFMGTPFPTKSDVRIFKTLLIDFRHFRVLSAKKWMKHSAHWKIFWMLSFFSMKNEQKWPKIEKNSFFRKKIDHNGWPQFGLTTIWIDHNLRYIQILQSVDIRKPNSYQKII